MKTLIYLFFAASLFFVSCSKHSAAPVDQNQETINTLSTTQWKLSKYLQGGVVQNISSIKNHFQSYSRYESASTGKIYTSYIVNANGVDISASAESTYKVSGNGTKMTVTTISNTYNGTVMPSGTVYDMTITELSSTKHVVTFTLNGVLIERTYEVR